MEDGPVGSVDDQLLEHPRTHWLEPVPDARVLPESGDPAEIAIQRQRAPALGAHRSRAIGRCIARLNTFLDTSTLFPLFGLPAELA